MNEDIRQLLVLQDRDTKANRLEAELESIDPEREKTRRDSIRTQQVLDQAKQDQRQLEVRRKDLENEVEAKKEQILKFSQQQLETKKNVEYQTLGREIDHVRSAISEIEEQEMELMEQQDVFKSTLAEANQVAEEAKSGEAKKYPTSTSAKKILRANWTRWMRNAMRSFQKLTKKWSRTTNDCWTPRRARRSWAWITAVAVAAT